MQNPSSNSNRHLVVQRAKAALDTLYNPYRASRVLKDRNEIFEYVASQIGVNTNIRYLEFGVANGQSIRRIATLFRDPSAHFVGFDSFEGLPVDWGNATRGTFSTDGNMPSISDTRVEFVKGWFQNTVGGFLSRLKPEPDKTTLVHFDADLYGSTLFLLTALWWNISEYYFMFDEFFPDELTALYDFSSAYPVELEFYAAENTGPSHDLPAKVFGKLRRTQMVI